jgi:predicted porin
MNTTAGGDKADAWTAGLKYDANNIYLAAMYSETRNMTRMVITPTPWRTKPRTSK